MNTHTIAAEIVTRLRNSMQDSATNQCAVVEGLIREACQTSRRGEIAELRKKLEKLARQAGDKMDLAAARQEYGEAQYHRGQEHALTLASLRVKSLIDREQPT